MDSISPLRYPGGKSWLVPYLARQVANLERRPRVFVEPFAGGASVGLSLLAEDLVKTLHLTEIDPTIAAFWQATIFDSEKLARLIVTFEFTRKSVERLLDTRPRTTLNKAFRALVHNRATRGGLMHARAGLLRDGERGNGIASRWYPATLAARVRSIGLLRERITLSHGDALETIAKFGHRKTSAFFVDPPYLGRKGAGSRLYTFSEVEHSSVLKACSMVHGPIWISYEDDPLVAKAAKMLGYNVRKIHMRSTHHRAHAELLLTPVR